MGRKPFNGSLILFFIVGLCCFICLISALPLESHPSDPVDFIQGEDNFGKWREEILSEAAEAGGPATALSTLVLAEHRTKRPDILHSFRKYKGGWDIANKHYWASVGFTGAAGFILAVVWFISFGLALFVHYFSGWIINIKGKKSQRSQRICLALLILFTCTAATGCILVSVGQDQFHSEAVDTLNYVVNQSDFTVRTLINVTGYLSLAKTVSVAQVFLPPDVINDIDKLNIDLNSASDTLKETTNENSGKIRNVFDVVRLVMILVAVLMLIVSLLGLCMYLQEVPPTVSSLFEQKAENPFCFFSVRITHLSAVYPWSQTRNTHVCFKYSSVVGFSLQHRKMLFSCLIGEPTSYRFIVSGWLLVAVTFILCGVFVILNNAIADTCMAMGQWVDNPHAETALSNILPCVDQRTTNQTLIKSKQVITDITGIVNGFIDSFANSNAPPQANSSYYNQSGPMMPHLCYPYDSQLQDRQCYYPQEVSMANASLVWENYTCTVSEMGFCTSVGRLTPDMYGQLVGAVNISYALEHYTPPLLSLQDCNFVRDTFRNITSDYCPPLEDDLRKVNAGLALISAGVMLSLSLWIIYANRPQREEEVFANFSSKIKGSITISCNGKFSCNNVDDVQSTRTTPKDPKGEALA